MQVVGSHAIVIGASMAGLLAARALQGPYERVTVLDRDDLPPGPDPRKGVPQGRHTHALLPRGSEVMAAMFPGLFDELVADGVPVLRDTKQGRLVLGGYAFTNSSRAVDPPVYQPSRPYLEHRVRARLTARDAVSIADRSEVTELLTDTARERVTGVRVRRGDREEALTADLVVDASGRSGRAPHWLADLGYPTAPEVEVPVDIVYATRMLTMPADALGDTLLVLIGPAPGRPRGYGLFAVEGGRWVLTLGGYTGHHPPTDDPGFDAFAASVVPPDILATVATAHALGPVVRHRFPASLRRRYDKLRRFPEGFLVIGDAVCSFNPLYGQGMTVAALQAQALRACLLQSRRGTRGLARRFFRRSAPHIDVAWQLAVGGDLALPEVPGPRPPQVRAINRYVDRIQRAAETDTHVADVFMRVSGLIDPPARLFAPDILARTMRPRSTPAPAPAPAPADDRVGRVAAAGAVVDPTGFETRP